MEESTAVSLLSERSKVATKALVVSVFVASVGAFNFGCIVAYSAPTQFGIMSDLGLSLAQFSFFGSILTFGGIIGAIASGKLADLIGRLKTIWITFILYISGWLAISFAQDAWLLDLGRFLHGVTTGIGSYLGPIYVAEITPSSHRGAVSSLSQMLSVFGISFVYIIGILVNWRSLALIGAATCAMSLPLLVFAVESPRWLAKNGRQKELEETLLLLRGENADIREEAAEILECTKGVEHLPEDGILDLFQKKYVFTVMIGVVLTALPQLGGLNGYALYTNSIFISASVPSNIGFISISVVQILGCIIGTISVDISGRRPLLLFSQVGSFLGCLITAISFLLQDHRCWETGTPILALTSVLVYFGAYGLGMGSIPWIIASEIYPVNIKGAAGTICNLVNWTLAGIVSYSFSFLLEWSSPGTFFIFACVCGLGIVFTAKLVPETKGKTLEEIQASLTDLN